MTATRSRKETKRYQHHQTHIEPPGKICAFCAIDKNSPQFLSQTKHFKLLQNIFPYSVWDSQTVVDHLNLAPVAHTDTLSDLSPAAAKEYVDIISDYESRGYSIYARAPGSVAKSIKHQHTHLIKLSGRKIKFLLYLNQPYRRILVK
jgi:diadenosine tetraphosphate (Ap4A) HIT family hydrolase